jgi:PBSX family phage portal protein
VSDDRTVLLKALVAGDRIADRVSQTDDGVDALFGAAGAIAPPYDPEVLYHLVEHSNALRQNIDAYATNIDGCGHRFEPAFDLDADDTDARVADALALELAAAVHDDGESLGEPTADAVAARRAELTRLARKERARLDAFFDSCSPDHSFVELRRRTRQDLETNGNAWWEVLRNTRGEIARLIYVPSHTVRMLPLDPEPVEVTEHVRVSSVTTEAIRTRRRMRRYVQVLGGASVYFKALGDPRVLSRTTGAVFGDLAALRRADANDGAATELLHFAIHWPRSAYGVPRWVGALLAVMGSRQMEEVNYLYFENKSVPPLALLVSGGRLTESAVPRIERFIEENLKGKNAFHRILILEADGGSGDSKATIELRPLTSAQQQDALFQDYDERNIDKVGSAFRLPRLLRGDTRDFNRATADAALRFAEDQVFQPERDEFDYQMNRRLLPEMGIRFWRFRSQTPVTRDPERMSVMVEKLVRVGVLTPEEGRVLAGDIFNREFRRIGDDWTKRPITLTLAGIQTGVEDLRARGGGSLLDDARKLMALRDELRGEEDRLAKRRMNFARSYADPPERVSVPFDEWSRWFGGADDAE